MFLGYLFLDIFKFFFSCFVKRCRDFSWSRPLPHWQDRGRYKALWNDIIKLAKADVRRVGELIGKRHVREKAMKPAAGEFRRILKGLVEETGGARRLYFLLLWFRRLLERVIATENDAVVYTLLKGG